MLKETNMDLFRVYGNYDMYSSEDPQQIVERLQADGGEWSIRKVSVPITEADRLNAYLVCGHEIDAYSTGGGFWTAQIEYDGRIYAVENAYPTCLTIYGADLINDEVIFTEENMIDSYDVAERKMNATTRNIYEWLIKALSD